MWLLMGTNLDHSCLWVSYDGQSVYFVKEMTKLGIVTCVLFLSIPIVFNHEIALANELHG